MRRLLFSTALVSVAWTTAATADPISAAIASVTAAFTSAFGAVVGPFLLRVVSSFALSTLGQLIQGEPSKPTPPGRRVEYATSGEHVPAKIPVGLTGVKGHLTEFYTHTTQGGMPNRYITFVIELADLPGINLRRVAIGDEWSDIGEKKPTPPDGLSMHPGFPLLAKRVDGVDYAWVNFYDGTQTTADEFLVDVAGDDPDRPWTVNHIGAGIPYALVTLYRNDELYSGVPQFLFEVDGVPFYDPRKDSSIGGIGAHRWNDKSTWEHTRNPKVIHYNLLRGIEIPTGIYGAGASEEEVPLDYWVAAMNVCDVDIVKPGRTRKQYEVGFEIDVSEEPFVWARMLDDACGGQTAEMGGVWYTQCGAPAPPVLHLTDDDLSISDPRVFDPFPSLKDTYNGISVKYTSPEALYRAAEVKPRYNAAWEQEDGRRRVADINLAGVFDYSQANQLGKGFVGDSRKFRTFQVTLPPEYAELNIFDSFTITSKRNGFLFKVFEIKSMRIRARDMMVAVVVRERDPSDYDWGASDELPDPVYSIGTPRIPPQGIDGFLVEPYSKLHEGSGEWWPGFVVRWTPPANSDIRGVRVQYRKLGQTAFEGHSTQELAPGHTIVSPLERDTDYQVRAKWIADRATAWSALVTVRTPDVGIPEIALAGSVQDKLNAADNVQQNLSDLSDQFTQDLIAMEEAVGEQILATGSETFDATTGVALMTGGANGIVGSPLASGTVVFSGAYGNVRQFTGVEALGVRRAFGVVVGRTYEVSAMVRVVANETAPTGNQARGLLYVRGLNANGDPASTPGPTFVTPPEGGVRTRNPLLVSDGWQEFKTRFTIPTSGGWAFWRPMFQYGASGSTGRWQFAYMKVEDVTEGSVIRGLVNQLSIDLSGVSASYNNIVGLNVSGSTAFGTFLQQLSVNASGVPTRIDSISSALNNTNSTVSIQGSAISNLQADASASLVMKVTSGGSVASIALVTANNASGGALFGSRVKIDSNWFQISGMAVFQGSALSGTYTPGSNGWIIRNNGSAEFNGVVISRALLLASRTFTFSGSITNGEEFLVNTGIRVADDDFWNGNQKTLIAVFNSNDGAYKGSSINGGEIWGFNAEVINAARWNGSSSWNGYSQDRLNDPSTLVSPSWATGTGQRILVLVRFLSTDGVIYQPGKSYTVKVYEVT